MLLDSVGKVAKVSRLHALHVEDVIFSHLFLFFISEKLGNKSNKSGLGSFE